MQNSKKTRTRSPSQPTLIVQSDYHMFYSSFDPLSSSFCPHTSSSTCSFPPVNFNKIPHTGVSKGTNIETLFLYAPYASGYFDMEMLSVKIVEDTKRAQSASDGASGARSCRASLKVVTSGCIRGPVGEDSTGNRVITPYSLRCGQHQPKSHAVKADTNVPRTSVHTKNSDASTKPKVP